jgi:ATP-dependent Clp protease ATP-binding subunit ClpC
MLQGFAEKSTKKVMSTIEIAVNELVALKQNVLTPDFILLALMSQQDAEAVKILERVVSDPVDAITQIKAEIYRHNQQATAVDSAQIVGTQELSTLFHEAEAEQKNFGDEFIRNIIYRYV